MNVCPNCNTTILENDSLFCAGCGSPLTPPSVPPRRKKLWNPQQVKNFNHIKDIYLSIPEVREAVPPLPNRGNIRYFSKAISPVFSMRSNLTLQVLRLRHPVSFYMIRGCRRRSNELSLDELL